VKKTPFSGNMMSSFSKGLMVNPNKGKLLNGTLAKKF
jgi:hypothetical protein